MAPVNNNVPSDGAGKTPASYTIRSPKKDKLHLDGQEGGNFHVAYNTFGTNFTDTEKKKIELGYNQINVFQQANTATT